VKSPAKLLTALQESSNLAPSWSRVLFHRETKPGSRCFGPGSENQIPNQIPNPLIYWSNDYGTIGSANLDGTPANPDLVSVEGRLRGLAVDSTNGYIYWANFDTQAIGRANLDGSGANQSFIGAGAPLGVAVDSTNGYIYWANFTGTIGRANLKDGSGAQQIITGAGGPQGITVDGTYVYWANHSGTVGRANLDGSGAQQDFISGARISSGNDLVLGVAVDGTSVYWSNFYSCTIGRANLDGDRTCINQNFITGAREPVGVAVDDNYLYWANFKGGIGRANLDGTGINQGFARAYAPEAVAVG
jgi:hypothetical protein